jgi:type VI secretion system protein ImpB
VKGIGVAKHYDGQKFIGKQRAPRVQIEYDVEIYGSQKKVELPFVVGVLADLCGDNTEGLAAVEERDFIDIDDETFDKRMAQISPKAIFYADDTLSDDPGALIDVDLTFKSMEDFEPAEIAKRIPELAALMKARNELKELATYMDGKMSAQDLIEQLLTNPKYTGKEISVQDDGDWPSDSGSVAISAVTPDQPQQPKE